jgi:hypothetical protein
MGPTELAAEGTWRPGGRGADGLRGAEERPARWYGGRYGPAESRLRVAEDPSW